MSEVEIASFFVSVNIALLWLIFVWRPCGGSAATGFVGMAFVLHLGLRARYGVWKGNVVSAHFEGEMEIRSISNQKLSRNIVAFETKGI
jgi:hypothetical protein